VAVKRIRVFDPLKPVDDQIGHGRSENLVADLQGITGCDDVQKDVDRIDSAECQGDDQNRVHGLTDDGGTDRACPEKTAVGNQLQPRHGVGIGKLARPESDETGGENAWNEAEDRREGLLVSPARSLRQSNDNGS
jgi:hypothetical protein